MNLATPLERRRFLNSGMRYALLAGLGGLAAAGETKRRRLANSPHCVRIWTCADCVQFGVCAKLKARDFRRAQLPARERPKKPESTRSTPG
jgi:hypothetical protein